MSYTNDVVPFINDDDAELANLDASTRMTDEKGRIIDISTMTDRELLEEIVKVSRVVTDKAEQFLNDLPNNPMFKMMGKFF